MSDYQAAHVRAVAIELKARIIELYTEIQPVFQEAQSWTLNCDDRALPLPFDVGNTLTAYAALSKPVLQLTEWGRTLEEAVLDDGLVYGPDCDAGDGDTAHGMTFETPGLLVPMSGLTISSAAGLTINSGAVIPSDSGLTIPS